MHSEIQCTLGNVHQAYMNRLPTRPTPAPIAVYSRASGPLRAWCFLINMADMNQINMLGSDTVKAQNIPVHRFLYVGVK